MFSKQSQEYRKVCTYWKRPLPMRQTSRRHIIQKESMAEMQDALLSALYAIIRFRLSDYTKRMTKVESRTADIIRRIF